MEAELGGVPSSSALVAAFLKVRRSRGQTEGGDPIWAHLFYLLRLGDSLSASATAGGESS